MRPVEWMCGLLIVVLGIGFAMPQHACAASASQSTSEILAADTPTTTVLGNKFVAPAGWTRSVRGHSTILEAPEGGSTGRQNESSSPFPRMRRWLRSSLLAARYQHPALGEIAVSRADGQTVFNFGGWSNPVATRKNPVRPRSSPSPPGFGLMGREFIAGERTLTLRDGQHEYVLKAQ